jgi:hypothetical protein
VAAAATYEPVAEQFVALSTTALPLPGLKRLQKAYIIRGLAKRSEEELLHLPPEIAALQTVIEAPQAAAEHLPVLPRFSGVDDALPAMPEVPPVSGEYEAPQSF